MRNLFRAVFLGLMLLCCSGVQAATVTYDLFVEVLSGPFTGTTGSGSFSYDDSTLTNIGEETLTTAVGDGGLTLELTVFGQTFIHSDDIDFSSYPRLVLIDGVIQYLDFIVSEDGMNPRDILQPGIEDLGIYDLSLVGNVFHAELHVNRHAVPIPAAIWLFGSGVLGMLGLSRRKTKLS
jgi:hypothetical protein